MICVCVFSLFLSILRIGFQYFDCCLKRMMIKAINGDVDLLGLFFLLVLLKIQTLLYNQLCFLFSNEIG